MRSPFVGLVIGLIAALVWGPMAIGQAGAGTGNSLYEALRDAGTGGPAPKHDVTGVWTGPLGALRREVPPMTPLGEKRFTMNKTERKVGWADSNDPSKTCDPFGFPRSAVDEITGIAFAQMPDKIIVLHQYTKYGAKSGLTGENFPRTST